jgi:UPF0176 protein
MLVFMALYNKIDKKVLKERLMAEGFKRVTLSFYRYVIISDVEDTRDALYKMWDELGVFGRIYVAREGINAQLSVPEHNFDTFKAQLYADRRFADVPFKIAVEDDGKSFYKLIVRMKSHIVADGLPDDAFDVTNVGKHLSAEQFNKALEDPDAIVVDMRNHYESEVGRFEGAICPDADTFRDELPMVVDMLKDKKDKPILMYCTGGIRCEKASAYLKHHGFNNVSQLHGGIIEYARQVKNNQLPNKFKGKNFVFDERLGERISDEVISNCHQCGKPCDTHTNCANFDCHLLFIQCEDCAAQFEGCCSAECKDIINMPLEQQVALRRGKAKHGDQRNVYKKGRLRPKLNESFNLAGNTPNV